MAGIYNGPARGGTRGGKDQFDWDNVKEDKYNQSYLGHSVKAPIGRWQQGRDLTWYTKQSKVDLKAAQEIERAAIKAKEQDLMLQLLGEKPMAPAPRADLNRIQKNKLLKKGDAEEGTVAAAISQDDFGERVEGIGYAPIKIDDLREVMETTTSTRLEGTGINELLAAHAAGAEEETHHHSEEHDHAALLAAIEGASKFESYSRGNDSSDDDSNKASKKEKKRMKKEEKKRKKEEKKEKKESKKHKSHDRESKHKSERSSDDANLQAMPSSRFRSSQDSGDHRFEVEGEGSTISKQRSWSRDRNERRRSRSRSRSRDRSGYDHPDQRFHDRPSDRSGDNDRSYDGKNTRDRSYNRDRDRRHDDDFGRDGGSYRDRDRDRDRRYDDDSRRR